MLVDLEVGDPDIVVVAGKGDPVAVVSATEDNHTIQDLMVEPHTGEVMEVFRVEEQLVQVALDSVRWHT